MLSLLAIPIVNQVTEVASSSASFFSQPIDVILFDLLLWFGWIPVAMTLGWGFTEMWLDYRRGLYAGRLKYTILAIDVPNASEQTPKAIENLFSSLYPTKSSITWKEKWFGGKLYPTYSFEIVSTEGYIQFLIRTQTRFRDVIEAAIYSQYPEAEISEVEDYADKFPKEYPNDDYEMWGAEVTLDRDELYPIRTYVDFEDRMAQEYKDPIGLTMEQLAKMRPGEHFWIQILVQPSSQAWQKRGVKHVRKIYGDEDKPKKSFLLQMLHDSVSWPAGLLEHATGVDLTGWMDGAPGGEDDPWKAFKITLPQKEEAEAVLRKSSKIGLGVKIRVLYVAEKNAYVKVERTGFVKGIFNQYTNNNLNKFSLYIPQVPKDDYFWMRMVYTKKQRRLMGAYQGRSWGVGATPVFLNVEELATIWHFPTIEMKAPLIKKTLSKRAEPPTGLPVTYLEDTLPGYVAPDGSGQSEPPPGVIFEPPTDDLTTPEGLALEESPAEPTEPTHSTTSPEEPEMDPMDNLIAPKLVDMNDAEEDEGVPHNLPV